MRFFYERVSRPFPVPVKTSRGVFSHRDTLLVRIERDGGVFSCGEVAPWDGFGCELLEDAEAFLRDCCGVVPVGIPENLPCTAHAFSAAEFFLEHPNLRNVAPADKRLCAKLIRRSPEDFPERILEDVFRERERGFSVFKIKIGLSDRESELRVCKKILEGAPAGTRFRFDANGAFSDAVLSELVELSASPALDFFEQPFFPSPENDIKVFDFSDNLGVKFALDESVREPWAFPRDTRVVAVVKPLLVSDFSRLLSWLENPDGPDTVISTVFENSSAGTNALRLACSRLAKNRRRAFGLG